MPVPIGENAQQAAIRTEYTVAVDDIRRRGWRRR
jgi:hypothetical protein